MKRLILLQFILITLISFGAIAGDKTKDEIIQAMLDVKLMEDILVKEQANVDKGVLIIGDELGIDALSTNKFDKPVQLIDGPDQAAGRPYILINEFTIKKESKAILKGTYDGSKLKFKCKKTEEGWMFTHLSFKGNGRNVFEVEF